MRKKVEHGIRRAAFQVASPLLKRGRNLATLNGREMKRTLVIRKDRAGDAICSLPVIAALKTQFFSVAVDVVGSPRNSEVFRGDPRIAELYLYRKVVGHDMKHLRRMRSHNYDAVIDLIGDDSVTSLLMSQWYVRDGVRIGVGKDRFARFYDFSYPYASTPTEHMIDVHLKALRAFGIDDAKCERYVPMHRSPEQQRASEQYFASMEKGSQAIRIGYNLSVGKAERVWPFERSVELVKHISSRIPDGTVVLFTTPSDRHVGERLKSAVGDRVALIPDGLDIQQVSALIAELDVLVTPDTALVHVARSWRKPVVAMYPEWDQHRFALWKPYGQDLGCVMSSTGDHVFDITVAEMLAAFDQVLAKVKEEVACRK